MKTTFIIQLSLLIFFQTLHFTVSQNSFPIFRCRTSNNFTTNTVYQANIETSLASVSLEVTKHYGFNKTPAGESPNIVTGVALCRGDVGLETCQTCVNDSHILLRKNCPTRIEALVWTSNCMLLYSNGTYISTFYNRPYGKILSHVNVSNIADYNMVLRDLAGRLRTKAASGNSLRKFATGDAVYGPDSTKVYALMQCAPDLSSFDCNSCLSVVFREAQGCCDGDIDVAVIFPACFIRYSNVSFYNDPPAISLPAALPPSSTSSPATNGGKRNSSKIIYVVVPVAFVSVGLISIILCLFVKRTIRRKKNSTGISSVEMEMSTVGSLKFDLSTIEAATKNFFDDNKIGEGGFGPVYKGVLANGTEVAVKRLSKSSGQGSHEFVNEVILMAKLQHRNLVRLLGFCLEDEERILIYEFVPNKSLDHFLFDPNRQGYLDWLKRYKIIEGIARGMLYLHHDSRLRIIHRDLKTSNVLLDQDMNAKISDFGLARIFGVDQTQASTNRIVGTYGYMSPEYAVRGQFSVKSDVFAFGVVVLEIINEVLLDEALQFTRTHLDNISKDPLRCDSTLSTHIQEALVTPIRRRLPRLEALRYIHFYQQQPSHDESLLKLAKLEFNLLQSIYKSELSQVSKWWKGVDVPHNLPYVRDRIVESFFWAFGLYSEPHHSLARIFLAKVIQMMTTLDDTYDAYGTYEELVIFTEAAQRWSIRCLDELPDYMKLVYRVLIEMYQEMEEIMAKEEKTPLFKCAKEFMKEFIRGYMLEAKWVHEGHTPTADEHGSIAFVTGGGSLMITSCLVGMGDMITNKSIEWALTEPPIFKASSAIGRLINDVATYKTEQERDHFPTSVECYMKQYGATEEHACDMVREQIENLWKDINRESLMCKDVPMPIIMVVINLIRTLDNIYKYKDSFTEGGEELKDLIKSLFIHPMSI